MKRKDSLLNFYKLLAILVVSLIWVSFFSMFYPNDVKSNSIVDLVVNNLVLVILNVSIAVFISLFAVHRYETRKQQLVSINAILDKIDLICSEMYALVERIDIDDGLLPLRIGNYCSYSESLIEYIEAIKKQIPNGKEHSNALLALYDLKDIVDAHYGIIYKAKYEDDDLVKIVSVIKEKAFPVLVDARLFIPKILGELKY